MHADRSTYAEQVQAVQKNVAATPSCYEGEQILSIIVPGGGSSTWRAKYEVVGSKYLSMVVAKLEALLA